jgi:AhpD family alkylhydroperoxidase
MSEDTNWYEAAFVVGVTNALNVTADGLIAPGGEALLSPPEPAEVSAKVVSVYEEIRRFYNRADVPLVFRILAFDALYLAEFWQALQHAFSDKQLSRRFKEVLAFAVSLTTRSVFGTSLHLEQMRRFGVTDRGVMEIIGVTQMFSSYTKIADTLQLEPDMANIAPVDSSPPPGSGS